MAQIIWTIIYTLFVMFIGYIIGKYSMFDDLEVAKISSRVCKDTLDNLAPKLKYIPKTEMNKELIIALHSKGLSNWSIAKKLKIHRTAVGKALRRWNIK